jgi:hypothetical protein
MPSSITTGTIYGIAEYGVDVYGLANVTVFVDGVAGNTVLNDTLQIQADANHVICTLCLGPMTGFVGSVNVTGDSNFILPSVEATGFIGTVTQVTVNRVPVTGVVGTTELGDITLETNNYLDVTGFELVGFIANNAAQFNVTAILPSVAVTGFINDNLVILENEVLTLASVQGNALVGTPIINATIFDFNTVADLYDRSRVVYVFRRTTSKDRTVMIPANQ